MTAEIFHNDKYLVLRDFHAMRSSNLDMGYEISWIGTYIGELQKPRAIAEKGSDVAKSNVRHQVCQLFSTAQRRLTNA